MSQRSDTEFCQCPACRDRRDFQKKLDAATMRPGRFPQAPRIAVQARETLEGNNLPETAPESAGKANAMFEQPKQDGMAGIVSERFDFQIVPTSLAGAAIFEIQRLKNELAQIERRAADAEQVNRQLRKDLASAHDRIEQGSRAHADHRRIVVALEQEIALLERPVVSQETGSGWVPGMPWEGR